MVKNLYYGDFCVIGMLSVVVCCFSVLNILLMSVFSVLL